MNNDNLQAKIVAGCMFGFILIITTVFMMSESDLREKNRRLQEDVNYYNSTYLRKDGGTSLWGTNGLENPWVNYDFRSLDGGKHWYAVSNNIDSGTVVILGEADKVYPGLMKCLAGWDGLFEYVKTNGPVNPTRQEDLQKLESAGFTVNPK